MDLFFRTQMGRVFFDSTLPRIATALERIAAALEKRADAHCDAAEALPAERVRSPNPDGA